MIDGVRASAQNVEKYTKHKAYRNRPPISLTKVSIGRTGGLFILHFFEKSASEIRFQPLHSEDIWIVLSFTFRVLFAMAAAPNRDAGQMDLFDREMGLRGGHWKSVRSFH